MLPALRSLSALLLGGSLLVLAAWSHPVFGAPAPSQVVVFSYHNSGSSMLTRLANLCGLYVGEEEDLSLGEWMTTTGCMQVPHVGSRMRGASRRMRLSACSAARPPHLPALPANPAWGVHSW